MGRYQVRNQSLETISKLPFDKPMRAAVIAAKVTTVPRYCRPTAREMVNYMRDDPHMKYDHDTGLWTRTQLSLLDEGVAAPDGCEVANTS
jgi:hypothetical protein